VSFESSFVVFSSKYSGLKEFPWFKEINADALALCGSGTVNRARQHRSGNRKNKRLKTAKYRAFRGTCKLTED
jgi:hypothetical protein